MTTTLADLLPQVPTLGDAGLKQFALILTPQLKAVLESVQAQLGTRPGIAFPVALTDGTYMLRADLLTEVGPGGLYHAGFGQLPSEVFPRVKVIPWADALTLLPAEQ